VTTLNTTAILENGAVLTKHGQIVALELEGDTGLFYCSNAGGLDTDRKTFDTRQERDEALLRTVRLYLDEGWQLVGEEGYEMLDDWVQQTISDAGGGGYTLLNPDDEKDL
jgi:hypothetical protein